jgi:hypothetical protein
MANLDVYFNQTDLQTKLDQAANKQLYLTFKTEKGSGATGAWNSTCWWGITVLGVPRNEFNSMAANESVNGSIRLVISNNNYSSFQLLCESTSQRKPLFIVNLAQG